MSESSEEVTKPEIETPKTFTLMTPVDGVTEITLEEPDVGQIQRLTEESRKHGDMAALILLIANQSKQTAVTIKKIKARDFKQLEAYLSSFLDE